VEAVDIQNKQLKITNVRSSDKQKRSCRQLPQDFELPLFIAILGNPNLNQTSFL
jgi:hypothetical protein